MTTQNVCSAQLSILFDEDNGGPECVCCPTRDLCRESNGKPILITKKIRMRSGCNGDEFDTWDHIPKTSYAQDEIERYKRICSMDAPFPLSHLPNSDYPLLGAMVGVLIEKRLIP